MLHQVVSSSYLLPALQSERVHQLHFYLFPLFFALILAPESLLDFLLDGIVDVSSELFGGCKFGYFPYFVPALEGLGSGLGVASHESCFGLVLAVYVVSVVDALTGSHSYLPLFLIALVIHVYFVCLSIHVYFIYFWLLDDCLLVVFVVVFLFELLVVVLVEVVEHDFVEHYALLVLVLAQVQQLFVYLVLSFLGKVRVIVDFVLQRDSLRRLHVWSMIKIYQFPDSLPLGVFHSMPLSILKG